MTLLTKDIDQVNCCFHHFGSQQRTGSIIYSNYQQHLHPHSTGCLVPPHALSLEFLRDPRPRCVRRKEKGSGRTRWAASVRPCMCEWASVPTHTCPPLSHTGTLARFTQRSLTSSCPTHTFLTCLPPLFKQTSWTKHSATPGEEQRRCWTKEQKKKPPKHTDYFFFFFFFYTFTGRTCCLQNQRLINLIIDDS